MVLDFLVKYIFINYNLNHNKPDPERERIERMTGAEYWEMTH